jgi:sulfide dehydrogenase cytochrome subunit
MSVDCHYLNLLLHGDVDETPNSPLHRGHAGKSDAAVFANMNMFPFSRLGRFAALITAGCGMQAAFAQDTDIAAVLPVCEACHGHDGESIVPTTPIIAGIDAGIIADAIYARQDGDPPCPGSAMCGIVQSITHDQAEALGKYFSSKPFIPAKQTFDADKAARGAAIHEAQCEQCHSSGGSDPRDQTSILAGQWIPYLSATLTDYAAGKREALPAMLKRVEALTPDDIDALVNFYASRQP